MRRHVLAVGVGLAIVALAAPVRADTAMDKLGRGVSNVSLGVIEVPAQIAEEGRRDGPLYAMSLGVAKGVGQFVTRELVGVYEVATFPAPVPAGYRPILWPEYPWQVAD